MTTETKTDIYSRVTNKIIADLEQGVRTWLRPWNVGNTEGRITRPLRGNGQPYQGINVLMLWGEAIEKVFACPTWMTYRQASELGAHVRKGERGSQVVYADRITRTETNAQGEEVANEIPFMKAYTVFNCEQIEGLPAHFYPAPPPNLSALERIEAGEAFAARTHAAIRHGENRAYYSISTDHVQLPPFETFRGSESYYATLLHELTHWTKHETRLNREFGRKRWGDEGYAAEELVAELGAAFLCADLGVTPEPREDHAAYLASWLTVLKNDKRAIFTAAAYAQKAADFLNAMQGSMKDEGRIAA
jgi:antirestriction protein ArdC